jgi:hypothetical protein
MNITPQLLAAAAGVLLSILFEYTPKLHNWYNKQPDTIQRLVMLACLFIVSGGLFGIACAGWLAWIAPGLLLACSQQGLVGLVVAFFAALIANQAVFPILPKG